MDILVIDDQPVYSEGLTSILQRKFPTSKVESLPDSPGFNGVSRRFLLSTDLILFGINSARENETELLEDIYTSAELPPVIVLSSSFDYQQIKRILDLGVNGVIPKHYSADRMVSAITECCDGNIHIPEEIKIEINQLSAFVEKQRKVALSLLITKRQLEVLTLIDERFANDEIADRLCVSVATIKSHINKIYSALNVKCRKSCLKAAYDIGLLFSLKK